MENLMKKGIIAGVIVVVLAVVGYFSYTKFMVKPLLNKDEFGYETIIKMSNDNYKVACGDAKTLIVMINAINKDFAENPSLGDKTSEEQMTPAMKAFEKSMDNLGVAIEKKFANDNETKGKVFNGVGEDVSKIFQVAVYNHLGLVTQENVNEFIDVSFCNAKPKEGYKSPLDINPNEIKVPENMGEGIEGAPEGKITTPEKAPEKAPKK